jgi:tRNA threonylcarbamoyladenosine biosynthesis protein TsaB
MALILSIETSTPVCSVALSESGTLVGHLELYENQSHAANLTVLIDQVLKNCGLTPKKLDAIAVSCGPGSYTGLRIGVSTAKGLCFALNKPLIALSSLSILAKGALQHIEESADVLLCPMIDARRMEVYTAILDQNLNEKEPVSAQIIDGTSCLNWLNQSKVYFFGDGALKCKDVINHCNATFITNEVPLAKNMVDMARQAFNRNEFVDVAYFEPFYLKDFVATTPKNKMF